MENKWKGHQKVYVDVAVDAYISPDIRVAIGAGKGTGKAQIFCNYHKGRNMNT